MTPRDHCILLVEDDADDAMLIQRAMSKADLTAPIHRVEDGEAACNYLAGHGRYADRAKHPLPTLILLDIKLPRRSGLEVLRWVRASPALAKVVIVMLTSSREHKDIDEAYACGANSYLVKPISPAGMQDLIKTLGLYWLSHNEPPPPPATA
jgi:CheY-like chemotaxis protein